MGEIKGIIKNTGLYRRFLKWKHKIDKTRWQKAERINSQKRDKFYSTFLAHGDLVFDVGANVGNRVENFLKLNAKVIAVEPQPACVNILKEKFGERIIIEQVGLGSQPGELDMYIADESTISTFSAEFIEKTKENKFKRNKWEQKIRVPITTMDDLISKHGIPVFCKIDVEGFETEVLKGLNYAIPKISFEYNVPELAENVRNNVLRLTSISNNYRFNYSKGESMEFELDKWQSGKEFLETIRSTQFLQSDFGDVYVFIQ